MISIDTSTLNEVSLDGRYLIEASAGTGKTYTITNFFVLLLLKRGIPVSKILVVTYTNLATDDLRIRIRSRLQETLSALDKPPEDSFLSHLVMKLGKKEKELARFTLENALQNFNEAAIYTIHGFCEKVLRDRAFESSSYFDTKINPNSLFTRKEIVEDFWRIHLYKASSLFTYYVEQKNFTQSNLLQFSEKLVELHFPTIIPDNALLDASEQSNLEKQLSGTFQEAVKIWENETSDLKRQFRDQHISQIKIDVLTQYFTSGNPALEMITVSKQNFFVTKVLENLTKFSQKSHENSNQPDFYKTCKTLNQARKNLYSAYDDHLLALKQQLSRYLRTELKKRNRRKNQRFFWDSLLDLLEALKNQNSGPLKENIRQNYKAVLIDEFQDTDPIQYEIFNSIYQGTNYPLFFIGDPKQSIYLFRGGDIFTYIKASKVISNKLTLDYNWRSGENMVRAVNTFFQNRKEPFVFRKISFTPVKSAGEHTFLEKNKPENSPLKIWFWRRPEQKTEEGQKKLRPITKKEATDKIPAIVASEVVRLLKSDVLVDGKSLSPRDIAILVNKNDQAPNIQKALKKLQVPSILKDKDNIFHTAETLELSRVLFAVANCKDPSKVRIAMETDLLGRCNSQPNDSNTATRNWALRLKEFSNYRNLWLKEGFIHMMRVLITNEKVRSNLLMFSAGERRLTNLLHIIELIQEQALSQSSNMESILQWLEQKRDKDDTSSPEDQPMEGSKTDKRLESDEPAVTILTIHSSKGLEFPVVFCPYSWFQRQFFQKSYLDFHDRQNHQVILDIGSEQFKHHTDLYQEEQKAEEVRRLYVSMTRAKYRCYLLWGAFTNFEKSAMGYLLNSKKNMPDKKIEEDLNDLAKDSNESIEILDLPEPTGEVYPSNLNPVQNYQCRNFSGMIPKPWGIYSFSSLISGRSETVELPDRDGSSPGVTEIEEMTATPEFSIMNFPKGLQAGNFFHSLFESIDFNSKLICSRQNLVREKLRQFGFEEVWCDPVCQMIDRVLSIPLLNNGNDLVLAGLRPNQRLHELAYTFPSVKTSVKKLQEVFSSHGVSQLSRSFSKNLDQLQMAPGEGLMKGFIDLVFWSNDRYFLVDWKSNFLGNQLADYKQNILTKVMEKEFYFLQYHLYTVALHRYLSFRLPMYDYDRHFGGIFYIFLRGIDPEKGSKFGIYKDYPSHDLILALDQCLTPDPVYPPKESSNI